MLPEARPEVEKLRFADDLTASELAALPSDELREAARRVAAELDAALDESTIPRTTTRSPVP